MRHVFLALLFFASSATAQELASLVLRGPSAAAAPANIAHVADGATAANCAPSSTCAFTITINSGEVLVVGVTWRTNLNGPRTLSTVAISGCGTDSGARVTSSLAHDAGDITFYSSEMWIFATPPTGSCTVTATLSGSVGELFVAGGSTFTGVNTSSPYKNVTTASPAAATSGSVTPTCSANEVAYSVIGTSTFSALTLGDTAVANIREASSGDTGGLEWQTCGDGVLNWSGGNNFSGFNTAQSALVLQQ